MADFTETIKPLSEKIGQEYIKTDAPTLAKYAIDHVMPQAVIFPKNTAEIAEVIRHANQHKFAVAPWGSGSKMSMGNPPKRLDLVICTKRLNHMLDVDTQNLTITVEAGVKFRDIQARLATQEDRCYLPLEDLHTDADELICSDRSHSGSFLPIDPPCSESATIGGVIATNSSGPRRLLYNLPRDVILGVRFVTPTGDVPGSGGKTVKNVSGYDISKLMVGAMGSLGIMTEMTFRLLPLPEKMKTLLFSFNSFSNAQSFSDSIFSTKLLPAAVDVMNATAFESLRFSGTNDFSTGKYVVAVAFEAFEAAVDRMCSEIADMAKENGSDSSVDFTEHDHLQFWLAVSGLSHGLASEYNGLIGAKVNCRISEWKNIFEYAGQALSELKILHTIQAHSGSGILMIHLLLKNTADDSIMKAVGFMNELLSLSRKTGGNTITYHAPVDLKEKMNIWGETGSDFIAMKKLKETLDPNNVMCPGRFVGGL